MKRTIWASVTVGLAALMTFGCGNVVSSISGRDNDSQVQFTPNQAAPNPDKIWAVDTAGRLFFFFSDNTTAQSTRITPSGLPAGEQLIAIDCRPRTGVLYGISTTGKLFHINKDTALCTLVANGVQPGQINADIDFNPVIDRIRQEADAQNVVLNPNTGVVTLNTDLTINGAKANAVGCAYTNSNGDTAATTQLFVITGASNRVYLQATPPSTGVLTEVGQLPFDIGSNVGFDFSPANVGYVAAQKLSDNFSSLLRFDAANSTASFVSPIPGTPVKSIAVDSSGPFNIHFAGITSGANPKLVTFDSVDPTVLLSSTAITGIGADTIVGCDFAPGGDLATGLKVLTVNGTAGKIYPVNLTPGATLGQAGAPVAVGPALVALGANTSYGVDIAADGTMSVSVADGTISALGIVTAQSTKSFRINVNTGAGGADPDVAYPANDRVAQGNPRNTFIPALGFTNNFQGAGATQRLRGVDMTSTPNLPFNEFLTVTPATGQASSIGEMGLFTTKNCEMDIDPAGNVWFCSERVLAGTNLYTPDGFSTLYRVGPTTGGAVTVARVGGTTPLKHFTSVPTLNANLTTGP